MGCTNSLLKATKLISEDVIEDVVGSYRDFPPAHFISRIDSLSQLHDSFSELRSYESSEFEVGGYKWKLSFYPFKKLNKGSSSSSKTFISLYLSVSETSSLPVGWELNVVFRFFLLDQIRDKYLMLGDVGGRARRFHELKKEMGFAKLMPLETFEDPSNGYLLNDSCVIGAEVLLVPRSSGIGEHVSMLKTKITSEHVWKIENFSQIREESLRSDTFTVGNYSWNLSLCPKRLASGKKGSISLSLNLVDVENLTPSLKVHIEIEVHVIIPQEDWYISRSRRAKCWFSASSSCRGWNKFASLDEPALHRIFLAQEDTCTVEVEIAILGSVKPLH